jgi:hypothetical protein
MLRKSNSVASQRSSVVVSCPAALRAVIWACRARIRAVHASILSNILSQRSTCLSHTFPPVPHRRRQQFSTPLLLVRAVSVTFPTDIRGTRQATIACCTVLRFVRLKSAASGTSSDLPPGIDPKPATPRLLLCFSRTSEVGPRGLTSPETMIKFAEVHAGTPAMPFTHLLENF